MTLRAFESSTIVSPDGVRSGALVVEDGRILGILAPEALPAGAERVSLGARAILPGLVDSHVHLNDPGRAEWEGFETGSKAAAAGGYTTLVDMPLNCLPATTQAAALDRKRLAAHGKCWVDWAAWGAVVADNAGEIEGLAAAGVRGFKCFLIHPGIDGFTMVAEPDLRAALPHVARTGLPLLVHAELAGPCDRALAALSGANWRSYLTYLQSRPDEAELSAIRMLVGLAREFPVRLHIVHLATAEGLELLGEAKAEGLPVTVETCPHYLYASAEMIEDGDTLWKCAPPIRSALNRERLWEGLRQGVIDLVATDHSPCPPAMKRLEEGNFFTAWGGIASLSVALAAVWTAASERGFDLADLARWMSLGPAKLAGCERKGRLAPGCDADFVVFDEGRRISVTADRLYQRHAISPYLGERLRGLVCQTYLRGECVFAEGEFPGRARGREYA